MRHTDIAIIGSGLAGSAAAATLGTAGIDTVLIDPRTVYPPDLVAKRSPATNWTSFATARWQARSRAPRHSIAGSGCRALAASSTRRPAINTASSTTT
ncbi:MAG: FAD-dependent monooxygenase [Devosia sp.]